MKHFGLQITLLLAAVGGLRSSADASTPTILAGPIVNPNNGHSYYLLDQVSWTDSQAVAVNLGGNLVTINDQMENAWVYSTFHLNGGIDRHLWIGFNDINSPGNFSWISGEAVSYVNWSPFGGGITPNNDFFLMFSESYGHMWREGSSAGYPDRVGGYWNDIINDPFNYLNIDPDLAPFNGVVEVNFTVPEPSSILAASTMLVLSSLSRRRIF